MHDLIDKIYAPHFLRVLLSPSSFAQFVGAPKVKNCLNSTLALRGAAERMLLSRNWCCQYCYSSHILPTPKQERASSWLSTFTRGDRAKDPFLIVAHVPSPEIYKIMGTHVPFDSVLV